MLSIFSGFCFGFGATFAGRPGGFGNALGPGFGFALGFGFGFDFGFGFTKGGGGGSGAGAATGSGGSGKAAGGGGGNFVGGEETGFAGFGIICGLTISSRLTRSTVMGASSISGVLSRAGTPKYATVITAICNAAEYNHAWRISHRTPLLPPPRLADAFLPGNSVSSATRLKPAWFIAPITIMTWP